MCCRRRAVLFAICLLLGTACSEKQLWVTEGDSAILPCLLSRPFPPLNEITVAWQTKEEKKKKGLTFSSGEEKPVEERDQMLNFFAKGKEDSRHQSPPYINRTRLISDQLQAGNFSLELLNVSMRDNNTFVQCVVSYFRGTNYYSSWRSNVTLLVKRRRDDDGEQSAAPPDDGEHTAAPPANSRMWIRYIAPFGSLLVLLVMAADTSEHLRQMAELDSKPRQQNQASTRRQKK